MILHAGWVPISTRPRIVRHPSDAAGFQLFIWGEKAVGGDSAPRALVNDDSDDGEVIPTHPSLASAGELGRALKLEGLGRFFTSTYYLLVAPINRNPARIAPPSMGTREPVAVQGSSAQGIKALEVLSRIRELSRQPDGVELGPDLAFWLDAGQFALTIMRELQFIPDASLDPVHGGRLRSFWSILHGKETLEGGFEALVRSMPGMCLDYGYLSHRGSHSWRPVATSREDLLRCFLDGLVNQVVTSRLSEAEHSPAGDDATGATLLEPGIAGYWLDSLAGRISKQRYFSLEETRGFVSGIRRWRQPLLDDRQWNLSLVAHPVEPETEAEAESSLQPVQWWRLELYMENFETEAAFFPARWIFDPELETSKQAVLPSDSMKKLTESIARGARVFPPLATLTEQPEPTELVISTEQFNRLLSTSENELLACGLKVRLSSDVQRSPRIQVEAELRSTPAASQLGLDGLVDFDWKVAIEDAEFDAKEFQRLVELRVPVVLVNRQYIMLSSAVGRDILRRLKTGKSLTVADAIRLEAEAESDVGFSVSMKYDGWISQLLSGLEGAEGFDLVPQPGEFQGTMRPYQVRGLSWLKFLADRGIGACLADDMGLGKTIQAIALILAKKEKHPDLGSTLIVCPTSVIGNWRKELERFAPDLRVVIHHGRSRLVGDEFREAVRRSDVVLTTYGLAPRDQKDLAGIHWQGIILDEAQNIKNPNAKRARALCSLPAAFRIALTGTPVENSLLELWSIMRFLNPGFLGSLRQFREQFISSVESHQDPDSLARLRRLIRPFLLRRAKTDPTIAKDLPDKIEMKVYCGLTSEQAELYQAVVDNLQTEMRQGVLRPMQRRGMVLATLTRLKQIVDHPVLFLHDSQRLGRRSGKLKRLEEMLLEVIAGGEKSLVFTQFAQMGKHLQRYLSRRLGREVLYLHGAVPQGRRTEMVDFFQNSSVDECPVFILSLKAGGTGLNLTAASHVFHYDRWWNPAVENQATDRAFRIGQTRRVEVHKFICGGTLEDRIDQLIETKRELFEGVIGAGEAWLTELSDADLTGLIELQTADILD